MIPRHLEQFLIQNGAAQSAHSGSTLWCHLVGVHQILDAIGAQRYLREAGLFHSVYGTNSFKKKTVSRDERSQIRNLIGDKSEELVWIFCTIRKASLLERALAGCGATWLDQIESPRSKVDILDDLLSMECANLLEQRNLYHFTHLSRKARGLGMLDGEGFSIQFACLSSEANQLENIHVN